MTIESNSTLDGEGWGEGNIADDAPAIKATPAKASAKKPAAPVTERRTRIILEDNDQIGPNGQFFGANGKGYMLKPGEEADVPDSILNILDTAVTSIPVVDGSNTVIGYRDRLRFPYRVMTSRRAA